jgi:L-asparaginase II
VSLAPELYSGPQSFVATLMQSAPGRVFAKKGAEGVFALGLPEHGVGLAVKVEDGAERGYIPVVLRALVRLGLWPEVPQVFERFSRIVNTRGELVGELV